MFPKSEKLCCKETANTETNSQISETESETEVKEPKSQTVINEKHYKEEKLNLLNGSTDYYKFYVFDNDNEPIYTEIYGPCAIQPVISDDNGTVDIHVGAGTGTYCDKFIDYENHLLSNCFVNVRAIGKEYVAYFGKYEDVQDGYYERKLVISKKYVQNTEKKYTFPAITADIEMFLLTYLRNACKIILI